MSHEHGSVTLGLPPKSQCFVLFIGCQFYGFRVYSLGLAHEYIRITLGLVH